MVRAWRFALTAACLAAVAETGFSHRLTAYKIVGQFFGLSYRKITGNNQVKNSFFRISNISVTCPHAQLRGRTVFKKLWTFSGPWGRDHSQSPPCWIFRVKQIRSSTVSERTTRQLRIAQARSPLGASYVEKYPVSHLSMLGHRCVDVETWQVTAPHASLHSSVNEYERAQCPGGEGYM